MKKFVAVLSAAALLTSLSACGATADTTSASSGASSTVSATAETTGAKEYRIAIVQQMDHASLDEIRTAIEAELDAKAAEQGITIEYKDFNGQNDATTLNQIGTQVVSDGYDAVIPIATLAAQCMTTACESTKTPGDLRGDFGPRLGGPDRHRLRDPAPPMREHPVHPGYGAGCPA